MYKKGKVGFHFSLILVLIYLPELFLILFMHVILSIPDQRRKKLLHIILLKMFFSSLLQTQHHRLLGQKGEFKYYYVVFFRIYSPDFIVFIGKRKAQFIDRGGCY